MGWAPAGGPGVYIGRPMHRARPSLDRGAPTAIPRLLRILGVVLFVLGPGCAPLRSAPEAPQEQVLPVVRARPAELASKFEGEFEARLRSAPASERFRTLVDLTDQVDLQILGDRLRARRRGKLHRRRAVIGALERVAESQQRRVRPVFERLLRDRALDHVRSVAIVNRLVVEGTARGILEIAGLPDVARVLPDRTSEGQGKEVEPGIGVRAPGDRFRSWAIDGMGAGRLWAAGLDGRGVLVASIDTGASLEHEQLRGRLADGARGWFDPVRGTGRPYDSHGHGTRVLSQAVGGNPEGRVVGVAPAARWATALGNHRNLYSRVRMTLAADWVLRVARPDVLINAWSNNEASCASFDLPFISAWKAAEIFVVFPAGNSGPRPGTGEAPAHLSGAYPHGGPVFSVAGLDRWGEVFRQSSRGPSPCGSSAFPMLAAPGSDLPFAFFTSSDAYGVGDGTSLAAGLVGGAAALLLQADPELSPDELEQILTETAREIPPPGRDDASGAGGVDLVAALERLPAKRESPPRTQE